MNHHDKPWSVEIDGYDTHAEASASAKAMHETTGLVTCVWGPPGTPEAPYHVPPDRCQFCGSIDCQCPVSHAELRDAVLEEVAKMLEIFDLYSLLPDHFCLALPPTPNGECPHENTIRHEFAVRVRAMKETK